MELIYKDKPKLRDIGPCWEYMAINKMICLRCGKGAKDSVNGKLCPPNKGETPWKNASMNAVAPSKQIS